MLILHPATAAKVAIVRANLALCGASARVRVMRNGALRVVLASVAEREAARDALVLSDACTASGVSFADADSRFAWNGPVEVFVRFLS